MKDYYPTVDIDYIVSMVKESGKVEGTVRIGKTTAYILKGKKPIPARMVIISESSGQVPYMFATGTAIKLKCNDKLMKWFEDNRNWKDGGYVAAK